MEMSSEIIYWDKMNNILNSIPLEVDTAERFINIIQSLMQENINRRLFNRGELRFLDIEKISSNMTTDGLVNQIRIREAIITEIKSLLNFRENNGLNTKSITESYYDRQLVNYSIEHIQCEIKYIEGIIENRNKCSEPDKVDTGPCINENCIDNILFIYKNRKLNISLEELVGYINSGYTKAYYYGGKHFIKPTLTVLFLEKPKNISDFNDSYALPALIYMTNTQYYEPQGLNLKNYFSAIQNCREFFTEEIYLVRDQ